MTETDNRAELAAALWPVRTGLTVEQVSQLIKPLNPSRIATRQQAGQKLSYLEAWDVKAHLTRIFGFAGWDGEVLESTVAFQQATEIGRDKKPGWQVGYHCRYRLRVKDLNGNVLGTWTEASVGQNSQVDLGEAHDTACKTAESDALKRCATALGDQFGLSLYDSGSTRPVVRRVIVAPEGYEQTRKALTAEQQNQLTHAVGHTEPDAPTQPPLSAVPTPFDASPVPTVSDVHDSMRTAIDASKEPRG